MAVIGQELTNNRVTETGHRPDFDLRPGRRRTQ